MLRCNGTSFGLSDFEALMNVAFEAKESITAHTLRRFRGNPSDLRRLPYTPQWYSMAFS